MSAGITSPAAADAAPGIPSAAADAPNESPIDDAGVSTAAPRPHGRAGRVLGWIFVVALLVGVALLSMRFVTTAPNLSAALDPESPGPRGAKAIAQLTREEGVHIEVTRSRTAAADAAASAGTLVLTNPVALSDDAVRALVGSADHVVLLAPDTRLVELFELGSSAVGGGGAASAGCELEEFSRVGSIERGRTFEPAPSVTSCFTGDDGAVLLRAERDGTTITAIDATRLLSNEHLAEDGNAALGLALLAQSDRLIWYVPSFEDGDRQAGSPDTLGTLTPGWVSPAIILLLVAGLAAIWWRGRRFGPLVSESLPVTVRASETMQGRARLTARAADAPHAAAAIRAGTQARLAARLALGPRAGAREVADAASDRLLVPRGSLYDLLDGPLPESDRDLVDLARRLAELETAVEAAAHTERKRP